MIEAGASGVALLCEYIAPLPYPVVVLSVCREQHDDESTCTDSPSIIFHNDAFSPSDKKHALLHAGSWSCSRQPGGCTGASEKTPQREISDPIEPCGLSPHWKWTTRTLSHGAVLVVEGTAITTPIPPPNPKPKLLKYPSESPSSLLLPTPTQPQPFPSTSGLDLTAYPTPALDHNALFLSRQWASSPLGPIDTWSTQLRGLVQIMMASPFPVLISYGPEYVLLYNEPYSKVIGTKHPTILGMKYGEAWPEVWGILEPVIRDGYQGRVLNVDCQEMFLLRGSKLEETYFSYSLIPIRDTNNLTCGLYIPNFDNTVRIVTERRIRSLHEISLYIKRSLTQERVVQDALRGMEASNSRDMHFALFYIAENVDREAWSGGNGGHGKGGMEGVGRRSDVGSRGSFSDGRSRKQSPSLRSESSSTGQSSAVRFRLVGSYGIDIRPGTQDIPSEFMSLPEDEADVNLEHAIIRLVRQARKQDLALHIPDLAEVDVPSLHGNPFGDPPGAAVVLPIRASAEDRLHGVMLLGLNTRSPWDSEYSNYIQLVKGLLATGLATIKLHEEDLSRAQYMAALNRQKNEELQSLLKHRTMELKNSELKFRSAFAACPAAIWIGSPEGEIWDMNQAYFKISGLSTTGPLEDWTHRLHPDDSDRVLDMFQHCKTKPIRTEFRFLPSEEHVAAGLEEIWVEATGGPVFDDNGELVMLSGALLDITQRRLHLLSQTRRADEALELKRLQDHFIDMLSHELRNPLSAICLSSDGVVESLQALAPRCSSEMAEEVRDIVNDAGVIKLCTVHMRRLVDDVLALSKIDNNILLITPIPTQPESMCREVMDMMKSEMLTYDINCTFSLKQGYRDVGVDWAELDPSRVTQILINLLTNAIKFTTGAETRHISITLDATRVRPQLPGESLNETVTTFDKPNSPDSVNLVFEISDTGVGMSDAEIQRLFQRFAQGSNRTHLTYGGSGLGLFICRRIAHLLGGEISVQSTLAKGSTFAFFIPVLLSSPPVRHAPILVDLPQSPHPTTNQSRITSPKLASTSGTPTKVQSRPHRTTSISKGTLHVLLVEDNEISQKLLKKQLHRSGCSVVTANDGVEAVELLLRNASLEGTTKVELILMDIEMPRKGGIEATQDIRALEADGTLPHDVPIIAVSANARQEQIQSMLDAGMNAVVSKPFQMADLLSKIEALTGRRPGPGRTRV